MKTGGGTAEAGEAEGPGVLQGMLDVVVERLLAACEAVGAAAAAAAPGAFVLPREVAQRAARQQRNRQDHLPRTARLADLQRTFGLSELELDLLVVAAAVEVDERVELLTGYAHDDLTRKRPSVGLAAGLCGLALDDAALHWALGPDGPLVAAGLLKVEDPLAPFPIRPLRCSDRVVRFLVGVDCALPPVAGLVVEPPPLNGEQAERIAAAMGAGVAFHYLRAPPGADAPGVAVGAASALEAGSLVINLDRAQLLDDSDGLIVAALREARLHGWILVAGPVERLVEAGADMEPWAASGWPTILHGTRSWDPGWTVRTPLIGVAPTRHGEAQTALWQVLLGDQAPVEPELASLAAAFRLTGEQVIAAAGAAATEAAAEGRPLVPEDLRRSARRRNTGSLGRLTRRVHPEATWDDLLLPAPTVDKLRELVARTRHRARVYEAWGLGGTGHRGDGLSVLFAGPSGTGKTLAAEVMAGALGLDLYVVDLSSVVDKFIGETEKNLERIFNEAERVNGVLLFDEADALFSKRGEASGANDRYANLETAYLLQRMESFGGTAVLTTNLRSNLDEAFARRLGAVIAFPFPDAGGRLALWQQFLGGKVPVADDVDLEFCAETFDLTGANIRNVAVAAAFFAADAGPPVRMEDVVRGLERELEKLGRLRNDSKFGRYASLLTDRSRD